MRAEVTDEILARFWAKVDKGGADDCWTWTAWVDRDGYGHMRVGPQLWKAHRFSYLVATGQNPGDSLVLHSCDIPKCVNPRHLRLGTQADNMRDMDARGRRATQRGEEAAASVLTTEQVLEIRRRGHESYRLLGREFGVGKSTVQSVVTGTSWSHLLDETKEG